MNLNEVAAVATIIGTAIMVIEFVRGRGRRGGRWQHAAPPATGGPV